LAASLHPKSEFRNPQSATPIDHGWAWGYKWQQRLEALLARVWARVERHPISEEEIDAEVERARTAIYAQGGG